MKSLKEINWYRNQLTFEAPNLLSYFSSSAWENFVKILEHEVKCAVDCDIVSTAQSMEFLNKFFYVKILIGTINFTYLILDILGVFGCNFNVWMDMFWIS